MFEKGEINQGYLKTGFAKTRKEWCQKGQMKPTIMHISNISIKDYMQHETLSSHYIWNRW